MDERAGISLCLGKIEEKLSWKPCEEWRDYEYNLLKEEIFAVSELSISTHTLKRLFGKIKYKARYTPQHATKDALAMYLGYKSWDEFLMKNSEEIDGAGHSKRNSDRWKARNDRKKGGVKILIYALVVFLAGAGVVVIVRSGSGISKSSFEVIGREGVIPHTVTFEYDISRVKSNNVSIDFDFVHPDLGSSFMLDDHKATLLNHTYQIPGIYYPKLIINDKVVDTKTVVVGSEGWVSFHNRIPETTKYWTDNMFRDITYRGFMSFTREDLARYNRDTTGVYYTTHRCVRDYGLSGDNFRFEMRFKNGKENGGVSCFDSRLTIMCLEQSALIWMVEENCHQYCRLKFGEIFFEGKTCDLSFLSRDLSDWIVLKVEIEDKDVTLLIDDEIIYQQRYTQSAGDIKGFQMRFKGSGMVDYMLLSNIKNDTVYFDDFG